MMWAAATNTAIVCVHLVFEASFSHAVRAIPLIAWAIPAWVIGAQHWVRRGTSALVLDDAGVELPDLGVSVPWESVSAVVALPRPDNRRAPLAIAFVVPDPGAVFASAQPPDWGARWRLRYTLTRYGALSVPAAWMDQPLLTVLTTARDYLAARQPAGAP
jgi:hypothetical protein